MELLNKAWKTPPTEKKRECGTVIGIAYLALVSFMVPFVLVSAVFGAGGSDLPLIERLFWHTLAIAAMFAGMRPVSACNIHNPNIVRCIAIPFSVLAWVILYELEFKYWLAQPEIRSDSFLRIVLYVMPLSLSFFAAELAAIRTKAFYSDASGSWLQSYTVARGFAFNEEAFPFEDLIIEDVMRAESVPVKRNRGKCKLMLYLDRIPDSDHVLALEWHRENSFFSLSFSWKNLKKKRFAITRQQAEQIAERFGPVKKTFFLDLRHNNGNTP